MRVKLIVIITILISFSLITANAYESETSSGNTHWVSTRGNDTNPGTKELPFKTVQKAANIAKAGDVVKIMPGTYRESITVMNPGTPQSPLVIESSERWGAVMTGDVSNLVKYSDGNTTRYITLRGIWFRDTPLDVGGPMANATVLAAKGWSIEDCRFTNCGVGVIMNEENGDMDDTSIIRCVFEDMKVNCIWSWGSDSSKMCRHTIKDTILRRSNTLNHDTTYHAGALKYLFTDGMTVDGVISYDNNGSGFWLDWDNSNFIVKNSTFFGNHGGMTYKNYGNGGMCDGWWAGKGFQCEGNPNGYFYNNTFYSNLSSGLGIMESGFDGGVTVTGCTFVDNYNSIELRALARRGHVLGPSVITQNIFKDWREYNWRTSSMETIGPITPGEFGTVIDYNVYDPGTKIYGFWKIIKADSFDELRSRLKCEEYGKQESFDFEGPLIPVRKTDYEDVGKPAMWQVPSKQAEKNSIDRALTEYSVGDTITIPATARKDIKEEGFYWVTEIYDLQARYVKLTMDALSKAWVESNVKTYASTEQTDITVKLTRKDPYCIEAVMGDVNISQDALPVLASDTRIEETDLDKGRINLYMYIFIAVCILLVFAGVVIFIKRRAK